MLSLCIQPDEGVHVKFEAKVPDSMQDTRPVDMEFHYKDQFGAQSIPDAYERLLLDVLTGDPSLFPRSDGIDLAWRLIDPILQGWDSPQAPPLYQYDPGSWVPWKSTRSCSAMAAFGASGVPAARKKVSVIERFPSRLMLARAAAEQFIRLADEAITLQGRFTVALSGGATPKTFYQQLAPLEMVSRVNWRHVHVFWGDERCVPPASPESNYRLAYEALLLHTPIPPENIYRMHGELAPESAAQEYEERLITFFQLEPLEIPRFDLILLGLGTNGHTASLFPYTSALHEQARLVVAPDIEELHSGASPSPHR